MNAEKYGLNRIYFGGCFIRGYPATIATLSYAIRFWSKGTKRALFLRHEGFLYVLLVFLSFFHTEKRWWLVTAVRLAHGSRTLMETVNRRQKMYEVGLYIILTVVYIRFMTMTSNDTSVGR